MKALKTCTAYPKFCLLQYSYVRLFPTESLRVLPDGKSPRWSAIWVQNDLLDYLPLGARSLLGMTSLPGRDANRPIWFLLILPRLMCSIATFSTMASYQSALIDLILYNHTVIVHGAPSTMTVWNCLEPLWFNFSSKLNTRLRFRLHSSELLNSILQR